MSNWPNEQTPAAAGEVNGRDSGFGDSSGFPDTASGLDSLGFTDSTPNNRKDRELLRVTALSHHYPQPRQRLWQAAPPLVALQDVNLTIQRGRSLGLVGESGSGKSTLARLIMGLGKPTSGSVHLLGQDIHRLSSSELRQARRHFQMVFQDPYSALDPRHTVERSVGAALATHTRVSRLTLRQQVRQTVEAVGLRDTDMHKYPHEFSGGQRIGIARALISRPKLIVADEPVSALDVSAQAQVLNLMQHLQKRYGVTYLLISHDLAVVRHLCAEVAVLYQGCIVERGTPDEVLSHPQHPYTRALVAAVPRF
jgi:peptide/nickel transport system ATP-binding protein